MPWRWPAATSSSWGCRSRFWTAYPHQLSGGMRQRVTIALATLLKPRIIIGDEPTTALDVVVQRGVVQLLKDVQRDLQNTIILVTHDMGVHANIADRIGIMYAGKIVEEAPTEKIFGEPAHPYTQYLINSLPKFGDKSTRESVPGSPPSLANLPSGCPFHPRCPHAMDVCNAADAGLHHGSMRTTELPAGWSEKETMEKLLEVENLTKVFSIGSMLSRARNHGSGQHLVPHRAGGDFCAGRRKRLRQDDDGPHHHGLRARHLRHDRPQRQEGSAKTRRSGFSDGIQAIFQDPFGTFNPLRTVDSYFFETV